MSHKREAWCSLVEATGVQDGSKRGAQETGACDNINTARGAHDNINTARGAVI